MRRLHLFLALGPAIFSWAAPPAPLPFILQTPYDETYDLMGGRNYLTPDDNLILDSMTAAEGMSKLKRVENAVGNLKRLLSPAAWNQLKAPLEMEKQLYLVLFWLARAYDAEASVEEVLDEVVLRGQGSPTAADSTLKEVLLYNFRLAQHLGVTSFQAQVKLGQGRPPVIPETDENPRNRLAFAVSILPPDRFLRSDTSSSTTSSSTAPCPRLRAPNSPPARSNSPKNSSPAASSPLTPSRHLKSLRKQGPPSQA